MAPWSLSWHSLLPFLSSVLVFTEAESTCFTNAVAEVDRKFLSGPNGPYPIGVWVCDWPAAYVTSEVVHILLEEILGFRVVQTGPGPSTVDTW